MIKKFIFLVLVAALATFTILSYYFANSTAYELLTENFKLKKAIANLNVEESIAYATVLSQKKDLGAVTETELKFVQTAAGDPREVVDEQIFKVEGDLVYFDSLIVRFPPELIQSGEAKAICLWRRVFGESTPPERGFPIESFRSEPARYHELSSILKPSERDEFWQSLWALADTPEALSELGVRAIHGNAVYFRMQPQNVYTFRLKSTGDIVVDVSRY